MLVFDTYLILLALSVATLLYDRVASGRHRAG